MTGLRHRMQALRDRDGATVVGLALSAAWLILLGLFWWLAPAAEGTSGGLARLMGFMGAVMPLALIWLAVGLARAIATLRAEADELRERLAQMRAAAAQAPPAMVEAAPPRAPATTVRPAPAAAPPARPAPPRAAPPEPRTPADARQTAMRFEGAEETVALAPDTVILALNFPDGPEDRAAVEALRLALRDHDSARVLRAAQDVVTLLAQADLYMDDLAPAAADAATWRRFAEGARGATIAGLGGGLDPAAVEAAAALLRRDDIFRDAAHHFLRHFDVMLGRLAPRLDDAQLAALTDTRSARAFRLLGRAAGLFG